ncbi:alpha/beta fold hydrolase [Streptomyces sp. NPDC002669]|uniref:alpha/beta fold hydrolase n=1 Tax=Streptomyces sp. NPDC002669 TaxID=3364658 RepID=UPI00367E4EF6
MTTVRNATLSVPGAELYYEVRGDGPLLLVSESGEGDARRSIDLVGRLVTDHTVVTYDRRGLSRSVRTDPTVPITLARHADDVHRLLAELTDGPVAMLGLSLGAVIGLHLAVEHPERPLTLIAHEPVAPRLLPAAERAHHERELAGIQRLYASRGLNATFGEVARVLGIDLAAQDAEPGLTAQPLTPRRIANFDFFLTHDFTAVLDDALSAERVAALRETEVRVVPALGRTTPDTVFDHRCARELSALLGADPAEFPGGHNGNLTHPAAYASRLREVLAAAPASRARRDRPVSGVVHDRRVGPHRANEAPCRSRTSK